MELYNHKNIEGKWQKKWEEEGIYKTSDSVEGKENFYTLVEFSYPSGNLHVGHWYAFAVPDIYARYKRMQGYNVLYPMGFDAFGLPAENAAIKLGADPKVLTYNQMETMRTQLRTMGAMFDWDREVISCDPAYYKWTQWMFNQFLKNDLVYRAVTMVNWCEKDKTVLANEQVIDGKCDRCGSEIIQREQPQWMLRITKYADRLIDDLDALDWPNAIKESQKNWIGRSEGAEIEFSLSGIKVTETFKFRPELVKLIKKGEKNVTFRMEKKDISVGSVVGLVDWADGKVENQLEFAKAKITQVSEMKLGDLPLDYPGHEPDVDNESRLKRYKEYYGEHITNDSLVYIYEFEVLKVTIFTTRADTLFGVTYVVLAPEHALLEKLQSQITNWSDVENYILDTKKKSELDRQQNKEKTGVKLEGIFAINPVNGEEVSIWIADYVLAGYGTGAVMAVPAHDERDFEFAQKYNLSMLRVIDSNTNHGNIPLEYRDDPKNYLKNIATAKDFCFVEDGLLMNSGSYNGLTSEEARKKIVEAVGGKFVNTYRLRDWGISRQRYWGCPIPIVYDPEGKAHPVPDEHLPWILPIDVDHTPDGTAPLARSKELFERTEKIFGKGWTPEVETMDTFVDSSWYFYRYLNNKNENAFADMKSMDAWMPIDLYMGGAEHTTMHLLYSRFWTKALYDLGFVKDSEAYKVRRNRGLILGPDGNKMSKSKGNVINPDEIVDRLGADTVRMYLAFMGPYGVTTNYPWDPNGVVGVRRFLEKIWNYFNLWFKNREDDLKNGDTFYSESINNQVESLLHKTIKNISTDIENFKFNTSISHLMKLLNQMREESEITLSSGGKGYSYKQVPISDRQMKDILKLLAPFAPHITEELWYELGETQSIHLSDWPTYNEALIIDDEITIGVQINGKARGEVTVSENMDDDSVFNRALENEKIAYHLKNKNIIKKIYVKGRIINFVVSD